MHLFSIRSASSMAAVLGASTRFAASGLSLSRGDDNHHRDKQQQRSQQQQQQQRRLEVCLGDITSVSEAVAGG
jgi:hypothetical protein